MGFKRTNDGRVFFKSSSQMAEDIVESRALRKGNEKPAEKAEKSSRADKEKTPADLWVPRDRSNDDIDLTDNNINAPKRPSAREAKENLEEGQSEPLTKNLEGGNLQFEVLGLLKSLNTRLQSTQAEREQMREQLQSYRTLIEQLEDKADRTERAYIDLEQKLSRKSDDNDSAEKEEMRQSLKKTEDITRETLKEMEQTRKLLLDLEQKTERTNRNIAHVQKTQKEHNEQLQKGSTRYDTLLNRIETAENKQETLDGQLRYSMDKQNLLIDKVDAVTRDRERFMRKIERIEEAVIQTRDSLNIGALRITSEQPAPSAGLEGAELPRALIARTPEMKEPPEFLMQYQRDDEEDRYKNIKPLKASKFHDDLEEDTADADASHDTYEEDVVNRDEETDLDSVETSVSGAKTRNDAMANANKSSLERFFERLSVFPILALLGCLGLVLWFIKSPNTLPSAQLSSLATQGTSSYSTSDADSGASSNMRGISPEIEDRSGREAYYFSDPSTLMERMETDPDSVARELNSIEPEAFTPPSAEEKDVENFPETETLLEEPETPRVSVEEDQPQEAPKKDDQDSLSENVLEKLEKEAESGSAQAQHDLAAIYVSGYAGAPQDYEQALYWFEKAADQGVANAQYNLGVLYHQGLGVKPNLKKAIAWYTRAADSEHPEAQYNLGIAYIEGIGVTYDAQKAAGYFESAAKKDITEAAYNLGLIYENGLLGKADPRKALQWYKTAADRGSPEAKAALAQLARALGINIQDIESIATDIQTSRLDVVKPPLKKKALSA